jgi:hypothetical protein
VNEDSGATGEFVNMGVALYAPEAKYISAICNPRYGRLSKMFLDVNGEHLRSVMRYVQARFEEHAARFGGELPLAEKPKSILEIAHAILPRDDSRAAMVGTKRGDYGRPGSDPGPTLRQARGKI